SANEASVYSFLFMFRRYILSASRRTISAVGPTALRARKRTSLDCTFRSLSLRDRVPEIAVLDVPDMFARAIGPTPSSETFCSVVTSAKAALVASATSAPRARTKTEVGFLRLIASPEILRGISRDASKPLMQRPPEGTRGCQAVSAASAREERLRSVSFRKRL